MRLVWLDPGVAVGLDLECRPRVMQEHQYVWHSLKIVRVVLEDNGFRIALSERFDELCLKRAFSFVHSSLSLHE